MPEENCPRWKIAKETVNFIQILLVDDPTIDRVEDLLAAGFEMVHMESNPNWNFSIFLCRKTISADFKKLPQD